MNHHLTAGLAAERRRDMLEHAARDRLVREAQLAAHKAAGDKPWHCPVCWRVPRGLWLRRMRLSRLYTCPSGHTFGLLGEAAT